MSQRLPRSFFDRPAHTVARELLGARLLRQEPDGRLLAGYIVEAEAYSGEDDLGCHAKAGRTARTQVMYGPAGHAYVYFTYGMHWMLNVVCGPAGFPAAALIRAVLPVQGIARIAARRPNQPRPRWTDGPAKLCQAFEIARQHNGLDLCDPQSEIRLEYGLNIPDSSVTIGPRVGLYHVPEPWKSIPWRYLARDVPALLRQHCQQP